MDVAGDVAPEAVFQEMRYSSSGLFIKPLYGTRCQISGEQFTKGE